MTDSGKKFNSTVIIVIAGIVIAGIIAGAVLLNKPGNDSGQTNLTGNNTTTPANKASWMVTGFDAPGTLPREAEPRVAEEFGYFKLIKIDYATLKGSDKVVAISTGEANAAHDSYLNTIRAVSKGIKVKSVAVAHGANAVSYFDFYVLNNSTIKSPKDLKGKRIGSTKSSSTYLFVYAYLKGSGVSVNDLQWVSIPTGQGEQILRSGGIDILPLASAYEKGAMLEKGDVRLLFTQSQVTPPQFYHCGVTVSQDMIDNHPELVQDFVQGFVQAADWELANPENNTELYYNWAVEDGTKNAYLVKKYHENNDIRPHALQSESDVQWFIDQLVELGELKPGQIKPSDIIDDRFNPYYNATNKSG